MGDECGYTDQVYYYYYYYYSQSNREVVEMFAFEIQTPLTKKK